MRTIKHSIFICSTGILFLLVPLVAFTLITSRTPVIAGIRSYVVVSGSMEPTIPVGSVVFSQMEPHYAPGDIITFSRGAITVTHRIVQVNHAQNAVSYTTKGDANNAVDTAPVSLQNLYGKELFHIPGLGKFILFLKTVPGMVLFVLIPGILFIGFELVKIKEEMEKHIEKKLIERMQRE